MNRQKIITRMVLTIVSVLTVFNAHAQSSDFFKPVRNSALRAPSVPLILNDPYFSIWSPYDKLTDGPTKHWTDATKPLMGALRVDGVVYRFLGKVEPNLKPIAPMTTDQNSWDGAYTNEAPNHNWMSPSFDDSSWKKGQAAFGTSDYPRINTPWSEGDIWVRRIINIDDVNLKNDFFIKYSHDDVFELYLNGKKLVDTGNTWGNDFTLKLTDADKKLLKKGKNVIAIHCHNTTGGSYVDFGLYQELSGQPNFGREAIQKSVNVLPTSTYYTFACGPVTLDLVFTAPMLIDDLDWLSTPINYISYRVRSSDKKTHNVQFYLETTPEITVNEKTQPTVASTLTHGNMSYLKAGTIDQPILAKKGDGICIDWGYLYLTNANQPNSSLSVGDFYQIKKQFSDNGSLPASKDNVITRNPEDMPAMAYCQNLGNINQTGTSSHLMMGYDEVYDIEYMYHRYKAYWAHDGKVSIFDAFDKAQSEYSNVMERCRALDQRIMDDADKAGGQKYAELCALAYRQVIAAHKLFKDKDGRLMFFSKENNSNGCVNTVDLTYPSAPLFLAYNPELQKGMMNSTFQYSASGRWVKPFPAHDLGTYPIANGQVYGGDMPLEEGGNMITLTAAIADIEGNANYAKPYWDILSTWVDYLVEYGQDPENQLCTDDFAGHWAHNANLSIKAIMGIAGYSKIARMLGYTDIADKYGAIAKTMATKWEQMANDGDHYRLAFDRPGTWSQKYNIIWDKMWNLNLFPNNVIGKEVNFYLTKQNAYGLPLDSRKEYTKSDWVMWSATLSPDKATFERFVAPIYKYANETKTRVPLSDWHHTDSGDFVGFKARSVVGGYWMKVLLDKMKQDKHE